jgi:hypothetical protein
MKRTAFIIAFVFASGSLFAQQDNFPGTWAMTYISTGDSSTIYFELQVAEPEHNTLYPAQVKLVSGNFNAIYQLLLVKKNDRQLAIGRNKFPVSENPFSLGTWTILLNGTFDLGRSESGNPFLSANRIAAKRYGFTMPALTSYPDSTRNKAIELNQFLKEAPINLQKKNGLAWRGAAAQNILHTYSAPTYFGIVDTLYTKSPSLLFRFSENNKADNDTVSVMLNGKMIIDKMHINEPVYPLQISLDTGLNLVCFFADNYGRVPPNTAKLNIVFAEKNYTLDFTSKENMSASFIVAKIYFYPDGIKRNDTDIEARKKINQKINQRETKQIDSIRAGSQEVTLALWDDAVEDGDSISLQINDEIYMPGIAVKKKPQFITVKLYPGVNKIIFIADNLGAISPNTSVLEIIDGKKRRSYMINTNLGQNNSIKILYEADEP